MTALKLHLRVVELARKTVRVVTPRPQLGARFSTNYYHDTWHILAGVDGAALLARLLWGLAFQRQPGTVILIDGAHLVSTPFDGDPADPILLVPDDLTHLDPDDLRALKLRLRRAPQAPTTIRWHTFGMADAAPPAPWAWRQRRHDPARRRERMSRRAGYVCFTAPGAILRATALEVAAMGRSSYVPLAMPDPWRWSSDGEVQVIDDFMTRVAAAREARHRLYPDARGRLADTADAWAVDAAAERLTAARRRRG